MQALKISTLTAIHIILTLLRHGSGCSGEWGGWGGGGSNSHSRPGPSLYLEHKIEQLALQTAQR